MRRYNGFTVDTEVWHSAGFYRNFKDVLNKKDCFMTDSFDESQIAFIVNRASVDKVADECELVEVTFGPSINLGKEKIVTVKCTPEQEFLTCYENNGTLNYKGNETFFWVKAKDLKECRRLVAEDANIVVKSVRHLEEKADIYSVKIDGSEKNYSIRLGVIVKGE